VFVVDGGFTDGTQRRAETAGARLIDESRPGYGRACLRGATAAQAFHPHELVAFLDGDGSCDPAELEPLAACTARADVVLGARAPARIERGAYRWHARAGNFLTATLIGFRTRRRVRDLSPYKVLRAEALARLQLRQEGFAWTTELVARACLDRTLTIAEIPISFRARRGGKSKVSGQLAPSVRAGMQMLRAAIAETAPRPRLVLMAKSPLRAKSRLAAEVGAGVASGFWAASVADTAGHLLQAASTHGLEARLMLSAADDRRDMEQLLGPAWIADVQGQAGLHEALVDVFERAAAVRAPFAIAVSGDNPALPASLIHDAVVTLGRFDAVLGPTLDGGYYLVGLRRSAIARRDHRQLLHAIFDRHVDSGRARDATHRAIVRAGLSVGTLAPWSDVDNLRDLRQLAAELAAEPEAAPATSAWLMRNVRWLLPGDAASAEPELQLIGSEEGEGDVRS
jgi:glycosyltransferase A (GT-A) superfamily protein (DUF2064 family)